MNYEKIMLTNYGNDILNYYPVYCNEIYNGYEPFKIVGIRENEIELEGDFSGGTQNVKQKDWFKKENCFVVKTLCPEELKEKGCQVHNVNCCGGGSVINEHKEYWK